MLGVGGASVAQSASTSNTQMESHLLRHGRLRRLGQLDEEQVEVGPLLGRGSFGRVYKGRPLHCLAPKGAFSWQCMRGLPAQLAWLQLASASPTSIKSAAEDAGWRSDEVGSSVDVFLLPAVPVAMSPSLRALISSGSVFEPICPHSQPCKCIWSDVKPS